MIPVWSIVSICLKFQKATHLVEAETSAQDVMEMMADLKRTSRVAVLQGWTFFGDAVAIFHEIYCSHLKWVNQGKSMKMFLEREASKLSMDSRTWQFFFVNFH